MTTAGVCCRPLVEVLVVGRGERIRTSDPSVPNRVLYQAEPRPDPRNLSYLSVPLQAKPFYERRPRRAPSGPAAAASPTRSRRGPPRSPTDRSAPTRPALRRSSSTARPRGSCRSVTVVTWFRAPCTVSADALRLRARHVDVQERPRRQARREHALRHLARHRRRVARSPTRAGGPCCSDTAMLGTPSSAPSSAPDTVPEYVTSSPRFSPLLMPETTRSGRPSQHRRRPRCSRSRSACRRARRSRRAGARAAADDAA